MIMWPVIMACDYGSSNYKQGFHRWFILTIHTDRQLTDGALTQFIPHLLFFKDPENVQTGIPLHGQSENKRLQQLDSNS